MRILLIASMYFYLFSHSAAADVRIPNPNIACLENVWLGGGAPPPLEYLRLEIGKTGTGLLAVRYLPSVSPRMYRVTGVKLDGYNITINTEPAEADAERISIKGSAVCGELKLTLSGDEELKWERKLVLEPAAEVKERIKAVEDRTAQYKATLCRTEPVP